jgi:hypothetical protein
METLIRPAPLWRRKQPILHFFFRFSDYQSTGLLGREQQCPRTGSISATLPITTHPKDLQATDHGGATPSRASERDLRQRPTKLTNSCGDTAVKRRPGVSLGVGNATGDRTRTWWRTETRRYHQNSSNPRERARTLENLREVAQRQPRTFEKAYY